MYTYKPFVKRVIDGDTFVCDIDLGFGIWLNNKSVRVAHVNCPERETPEGAAAKVYTTNMLAQANEITLCVKEHKGDKFGRILAEVSLDGRRLDKCLIEDGHAVRYEGGRKDP